MEATTATELGGDATATTAAAEGESGGAGETKVALSFGGWVYHLGVNSVGREYCHLRYLEIRGRYLFMYKRDPADNNGTKPIRRGVISHTLMVEELGRKKVNQGDLYVLKLYDRLDGSRKGEIACASAGEARKWMEAFEQAKQLAEYHLLRGSGRDKLNSKIELNLGGHRKRVRQYARRMMKIGKGPEELIRQSSKLGSNLKAKTYSEGDVGDAVEAHQWRCIHTVDGIRIFQDVGDAKVRKGAILKAVGVVNANLDIVFEVVLSLEKYKRYEWDMLTGDLELVENVDGHRDVVYGAYDPKFLPWWHSKKDFIFTREWFRGQDGSYTILQSPSVHEDKPPRSGYQRTNINPSVWEIRELKASESNVKCLVTQMLEVHYSIWDRWTRRDYSNFEKSIHYALLCQVAGLKEYFEANPTLRKDTPSTLIQSTISDVSSSGTEFDDSELKDEFYDAMADDDSSEDEDSDEDTMLPKVDKLKLKNVSWAIASLALKQTPALVERSELNQSFPIVSVDPSQFRGSLPRGKGEADTNCWHSPSGQGFMIRGKNYLSDYAKVNGGEPLLKLLAVDWLKAEDTINEIALHPNCLVQSEAGRKLPFVLIINLQIPAKPNYSLVLYFGAERPVNKGSLLDKFVNGTDVFRDARFKLIPSIIEGYWMVKRAVGTKACLLGRAVTCRYLRQDNFLEIDVDIGSSSVAKRIINLVLGYITSIVVDLAILIEAKEEDELPEYILGTVRLSRVKLDCAAPI